MLDCWAPVLTVIPYFPVWCSSPPERHHWGRRDRPVLFSSLVQDENFHHLIFSQHHPQVPLDESRQYNHTSTPPRMLHPAASLPHQSPIMVDLHDQVTDKLWMCAGLISNVSRSCSLIMCSSYYLLLESVLSRKLIQLIFPHPPFPKRCTRDQYQYHTLLQRWRPMGSPSTLGSPFQGATRSSSQHAR